MAVNRITEQNTVFSASGLWNDQLNKHADIFVAFTGYDYAFENKSYVKHKYGTVPWRSLF